ncbi:hypothetical protein I5E68_15385 [Novosphingobium sp. YJ-S2-02]|uniref:Uncharacterized protein n=1 Tax=Novosphingobium aureum TaxID=2792964 RepID=A0A931HDX4_9SPHN|nr:hypothetical protein [Novosphingobium aureum]MBH0114327.1 hypothetical protein [Novosphingobium aureum]
MAIDFIARALGVQHARRLASSKEGDGAALVGTAAGMPLQSILDRRVGVPVAGVGPGEDAADAIEAAHARALVSGSEVLLPPYTVTLSRPVRVNRLRGVPGRSAIDTSNCAMGVFPLSQFCIVNEHWSMSYDPASADTCSYRGFEIVTTPGTRQSLLGLANVRHARLDQLVFTANRNLDNEGKPVAVDALLDFYAAVHGASVRRCQFRQWTGAYGATRVAPGGGGCIWIRNHSGDGTDPLNITQNVSVRDCDFEHYTSDECVAIYGVRGPTRKCRLDANRITGLEAADIGIDPAQSVYRPTLLAIFPLDDGSGTNLGDTAAVYENTIADNEIIDKSTLYNTIRIGNSADAARRCENNRSQRNKIAFKYWSDATNGHYATWLAAGGTSSNPAISCIPIRCIEGSFGAAYSGSVSGNVSLDDELVSASGSSTIFCGFMGWQLIRGARVRGAVSNGAISCTTIEGGQWEVSLRVFSNCNQVIAPWVRINVPGSAVNAVLHVDSAAGGTYTITGARVENGSLVYVGSAAGASTIVNVQGCSGTLSPYDALTGNRTGAVIRASGNHLSGPSAASAGTSTFKLSGNTWGATED